MRGRLAVELDPYLSRHRVVGYLEGRLLQRPGRMVDLAAVHALLVVDRVEAVALGHPVFERAGRRGVHVAARLVLAREAGGGAVRLGALMRVADAAGLFLDADLRLEVRDAVDPARGLHGEP